MYVGKIALEYVIPVGSGNVNFVFAKNLKLPAPSNTAIDSDGSEYNLIFWSADIIDPGAIVHPPIVPSFELIEPFIDKSSPFQRSEPDTPFNDNFETPWSNPIKIPVLSYP